MSTGRLCSHCDLSDCDRRKDDKIRCTRYSQWVNPNDVGCGSYSGAMLFAEMTPEKMREIAALYRDFLRDNNK